MDYKNIDILNTFTLDAIPDLDVAVLGALELFQKDKLPKLVLPPKIGGFLQIK